jgi:protein SCO1
LVIPAMAYIFLQMFGDNRYDVPIFYEHGVDRNISGCEFTEAQHHVPIHSFSALSTPELAGSSSGVSIFSFMASDCDDTCQTKFNQLSRIADFFGGNPQLNVVSIIYYDKVEPVRDVQITVVRDSNNWIFIKNAADEIEQIVKCGLVMPYSNESMHQFVLVDKEQRIRGYYNGLDVTDVDRLITEIRILLANYERQSYEHSS